MIAPELELRPIARNGISAEEIELRRYAASEVRGQPRCLLVDFIKNRGDRRRATKTTIDYDQEMLCATAHAKA